MKNKFRYLLLASCLIGVILTALKIPLYLNFVNPQTLLVTESAIVTAYKVITTILIVVLFVLSFFISKKASYPEKIENTSFVAFTSYLLGFLFVIYFVFGVIMSIRARLGYLNGFYSNLLSQGTIVRFLYIAGIIISLPCAVYFIVTAMKKNSVRTASHCFLSLFPVLWVTVQLVCVFMRDSAIVNAAGKKLDIITLCFCVFFFLSHSKLTLPASDTKTHQKSIRIYFTSGYCAIITLIISQVSIFLLEISNYLNSSDTYIISAIYIVMFLYIVSKIDAVVRSFEN